MTLTRLITATGFWVGALLPLVYLPVFVAGIDSATRFSMLLALLLVNVLALIVGHEYPETRSARQ
ncbi:hypothetical protein OB905_05325 [Halobacteria archaeon AArc-dxtr1]|nr:hypothetical protein [Halobacteria archaeon AArc-dxtr1]